MATVNIVEGELPILETATSVKMFNHLGKALINAEKTFNECRADVKEYSIVVVTETIEDLIC